MPSNLKKLVEARRAKTGESYQTALRQVRAQAKGAGSGPRSFKRRVLEIVRLAYERQAKQAHPEASGNGPLSTRHVTDFEDATGADATDLRAFLDGLPLDALHKIEALMYAGRSGFDVLETFREIPKEDKEGTIRSLVGKLPLGEYLELGLERAEDAELDIESDFAAYPEGPPSYVIDMSHIIHALDPTAPVPGPARQFAEYVGSIVRAATERPRGKTAIVAIACRQCSRHLAVRIADERAPIEWECPACGERGIVSNWRGTSCDVGSRDETIH